MKIVGNIFKTDIMGTKFCIEKYEIKIYERFINSHDEMATLKGENVSGFHYEPGTRKQY